MSLVVLTLLLAGQTTPPRVALTADVLKALKATSNNPAGDAFVDEPGKLNALIDAFTADSSFASPMYLYLAANTASRLGRVDDAAFLLYAAQLRKAFDYRRYDVSAEPNGNNAATYFGFLNQTTGTVVNPAIMRQPALFKSVVARIEAWALIPSPQAYYPEFAEARGFKLDRSEWPATARALKEEFLTKFGRRMATLLNDREYFEAFTFVQQVNMGEVDAAAPAARDRLVRSMETMAAAEQRLFGGAPAAPSRATRAATAPPRAGSSGDAPVRVGGSIKEPKILHRVEPTFPRGARGSVILEITIGKAGHVTDVRVLRGDAELVGPAEAAVRAWVYESVFVNDRPVPVIHTVSFTAR